MAALREALRNLSDDVFFDLLEDEEEYLVLLDVPGVERRTIEVYPENGEVTVKGVRPMPDAAFEFVDQNRDPHLEAAIPMPAKADPDAVHWSLDGGVLELHLPKRTATD